MVIVKVPASTANLGPGFDSLGMALSLYAWVGMSAAEETKFHLYGEQMAGIPEDKSNLIYQVAQLVFERAGVVMPELEISMYSDIPLTRGLGSSASAIVGALTAANALIGSPFEFEELFQIASSLEKHPDNVGASLFGGIIAAYWDGADARHIRLDAGDKLEALVAIPDFQLSTEKARHVLPSSVPMKDAVFNIGHSNLLVAALCTGRYDMLRLAMKDALHQPYRSALIPGMAEVLTGAAEHGALGIALSGAGPTLIALMEASAGDKARLEVFLAETLNTHGVSASMQWLKPSGTGATVLTRDGDPRTFMETVKGDVSA
ncbi:homoserine kinase [Gorillibacterium massiliense]|uniref:homoserine kinase n=1 Tax=Gorillibacterium massiliense TaxID=1280390 RepID=UPI000593B9C2|nr:homoserine kinase [Gorillibacterium massiliense]